MSDLVCREAAPDDVGDLLSIRNAIFPPVSAATWRQSIPAMTASLAYLDGEIVGAIPLDQREFLAAPGAVISTAFENAVGTREDMRSKGIGGQMIAAAKEFLADRCDMLLVYRGAERSTGYNFYVKSGHRDLIYCRHAIWVPQVSTAPGAVLDAEALYGEEDEVLRAFTATYAGYGGFPPRQQGYWRAALCAMIYEVIPQEIVYCRYPAEGPLQAYVLAGQRQEREGAEFAVLEAASLAGPAAMAQAFLTLGAEARRREAGVTIFLSGEHPWLGLCRQLGFVEELRSFMIMGQVIRPQELFRKVCVQPELLDDLRLKVWTPTVDCVLHEGSDPVREITLEAKDEQLMRLLCRRLDLSAAVQSDLVSFRGATPQDVQRLSRALPYAPWCYLHIDYI